MLKAHLPILLLMTIVAIGCTERRARSATHDEPVTEASPEERLAEEVASLEEAYKALNLVAFRLPDHRMELDRAEHALNEAGLELLDEDELSERLGETARVRRDASSPDVLVVDGEGSDDLLASLRRVPPRLVLRDLDFSEDGWQVRLAPFGSDLPPVASPAVPSISPELLEPPAEYTSEWEELANRAHRLQRDIGGLSILVDDAVRAQSEARRATAALEASAELLAWRQEEIQLISKQLRAEPPPSSLRVEREADAVRIVPPGG